MFKWSVSGSVKRERWCDFVGWKTRDMMGIVSAAADIIKTRLVGGRGVNAEIDQKGLVGNVNWGAFHCQTSKQWRGT